jgi:hypothetical protein
MPGLFNSCRKTPACLDGKLMANDLEADPRPREPASDLRKLVGDTGIEPVTSSVSKKKSNLGSRSRSDGVERGASHQQKRPEGVCGALRALEPVGSPPRRERAPMSIKIDDDFICLEIDGRTVATARRRPGGW